MNIIRLFLLVITIFGITIIESKEKYPKYLVIYRNNTFKVSHKPYFVEGHNKEAYPGKCYHNNYKVDWNEGSVFHPPDNCKRMTCMEKGRIQVEHCGAVTVNDPCRSHREGDGHYPNCCWIFKCKDLDKKEFLYNPLTPYEGTLEED